VGLGTGAGVGKVTCAWPRLGPFVDEIRRWRERQGAEIGGKRVKGKGEINLDGLVTKKTGSGARGQGPGVRGQGSTRSYGVAEKAFTWSGETREAEEVRKTERINSPFVRPI